MKSFQGKYHVDVNIKEKLRTRQRLSLEEYKINYRGRAVRNLQNRVMDHIFGDKTFKLQDLSAVCKWMKDEEAEKAFVSSRLIATRDGSRDAELSDSTISTMARAMMELLNYVRNFYSDLAVQEATAKALVSVHGIERTALRRARNVTTNKGYLEKENYLIPITEIMKFVDSEAHTGIIRRLLQLVEISDADEQKAEALKWTRKEVFRAQCHMAILLTLHTGKRPGVLCGMKIQDVLDFRQFQAETSDEVSYQISVIPTCQWAMFKTVVYSIITISGHVLKLLEALCCLRVWADKSKCDGRVFTSMQLYGLLHLAQVGMKAWKEAGCKGRFTSTMMRHTIVTAARDLKNNMSLDDLKALARGMDHSLRMAEDRYYHDKEAVYIDHSSIIRKVLKLNDWAEEVQFGIEEDVEDQGMNGELELIEAVVPQGEEEDEAGKDGESSGKERKAWRKNAIS